MLSRALPLVALLGLWPSLALAQATPIADSFEYETAGDDVARNEFDMGRAALEAGHPEEALAHFQEAHRLSGRPELLYNIGLVEDRLRHDRAALDAFETYLVELPLASNRPSVEDRIRVLREEIARQDAVARAIAHPQEDIAASPILWTIVAIVVVGAGVGIGVGVALGGDPGTAAPTPGPSGIVISALSF